MITAKEKQKCHSRGVRERAKQDGEALEGNWNGDWHQTDWTKSTNGCSGRFFNILAQAENTTCSDTHEMIRLKNGIAVASRAREKEKETGKFGLVWRKCGEITLLDTHVLRWGGEGQLWLPFQVMCTAAAIDSVFKVQVIPHHAKRKDKVKWRGKTGSHPELTAGVKGKRPHCIWNRCADGEMGRIWERISQSFVRIDPQLQCLKCVRVCALVSTSVDRNERDGEIQDSCGFLPPAPSAPLWVRK